MKLIVPHTGELRAADSRLLRLAEFLGISCESVLLDKHVQRSAEYIEKVVSDQRSCLVINPQVMREWLGGDVLPGDLVSRLLSHFPYLLVHAVTSDPSVAGILASLSDGELSSVRPVEDAGQPYEITPGSNDVCGPFSGLSFGPVKVDNDHTFCVKASSSGAVRNLICIGSRPFMVALTRESSKILLIASEDVADIDTHAGYSPLDNYFSRLMPQAMALRYIFGEECWCPGESYATMIIDDPLLRPNYGFLNYESLLRLSTEHNFHAATAFIPHNYQRNSKRILRLFRDNASYLSLCYHGNDHTRSEFASRDTDFLNSALAIAEERMKLHYQATGLRCDRVMVFPGSDFSEEAMQVLKSRNFYAAVSSAWHPLGQPSQPLLREICQPAVLRFGGFPLFGRNAARDIRSQDVAFNLFFGKPILTGEHHDTFKDPQSLVPAVHRINAVSPGIRWSNLETAVSRSFLRRRATDGTRYIKGYSSSVTISNSSDSVERFCIVWSQPDQCAPFEHVFHDATVFPSVDVSASQICAKGELAPRTLQTFTVMYRNNRVSVGSLGFPWNARAFFRRRFSEVRDNYLSKNQRILGLARTVQHRLWS
jgi:hypothetical protein